MHTLELTAFVMALLFLCAVMFLGGCAVPIQRPVISYMDSATGEFYAKARVPVAWGTTMVSVPKPEGD